MQLAGGSLGWNESRFWNATPAYFRAALIGLAQFHGQSDEDNEQAPGTITPDRYEALKEWDRVRQQKRAAQKSQP
ncbi:MAG: hypothetical protein AAF890_03435 [Pseudomonadota bacterium]